MEHYFVSIQMFLKVLFILSVALLQSASFFITKSYHFPLFSQQIAYRCTSSPSYSGLQRSAVSSSASPGVQTAINYLNSNAARDLLNSFTTKNEKLKEEMQKLNFWTNGNFIIQSSRCIGIVEDGLQLEVSCLVKGKPSLRSVVVPFPSAVTSEEDLKTVLVRMATSVGRIYDTGSIMKLPFGQDVTMPKDFLFNNVPHASWVRSYLYQAAADAVVRAIRDDRIKSKSRLQLTVNIPEVNPAYDTYRIGTLLEMVRYCTLTLIDQMGGCRIRICVQQSLGEGIFTGLPLALSSMRPTLERMDWGSSLSPEQKYQRGDNDKPRHEALIRLGAVGKNEIKEDDDVVFVIAPQNVIGGMVVDLLEEMVIAANGRPLILINPLLADRPSSNNMMQIRGRAERQAFADSFQDVFAMRLLYPSSGGYMFPIRGMISKKDYHSPWVVYNKQQDENGREVYEMIAALDPYASPDRTVVSDLFQQ